MPCHVSSIISLVDLNARVGEVLAVVWRFDGDKGESQNCLSGVKFGLKFDQFSQLDLVGRTNIITLVKSSDTTVGSLFGEHQKQYLCATNSPIH